jgi:hypothetical protein
VRLEHALGYRWAGICCPSSPLLSPIKAGEDGCSIQIVLGQSLPPLWSLLRELGPRGRQVATARLGEVQCQPGGRVSLKQSWEGEPTWAAAGPDGA